MFLPKTLVIRGCAWRIVLSAQPIDDNGEFANGTACGLQKQIELKRDLPPSLLLETFLHEYIHAVWFEQGIDEEDIPVWIEHMVIAGVSKDVVNNKVIFQKILASCKGKF